MDKPKAAVDKPVAVEAVAAEDDVPHPDYPGLTRHQVKQAQASARKKLEAARVKAAMSRAEKAELERLEREEGIVAAGVLGEMVEIKLDLALPMPYIMLDGKKFLHGHTYTVTRAQANDLFYIQWKGHEQEAARLGVDRFAFYQQAKAPEVKNVGQKVVSIVQKGAA